MKNESTVTYLDLLESCIDKSDAMTMTAIMRNAKMVVYDNVTALNVKHRLSSVVEGLRSTQQSSFMRGIDKTTKEYAIFNINSRKYYNDDGVKTFYMSECCLFDSMEEADECCDYSHSDIIVSVMIGSKTGHYYFGDFEYMNRESIESLVEYNEETKEFTND